MIATLREDNQLDIPDEIVRQFRLEAGSRLDWNAGEISGTILVQVMPIEKPAPESSNEGKAEDYG